MLGRLLFASILVAGSCSTANAAEPVNGVYIATAYSQKGITAAGQFTHRHVVAADPAILPLGSRIKIKLAGRYSGEYVVADTGDKIQGRRLDIYLPSTLACKKFGTKPVKVRVIELGEGTHASAKQADQAVKQDVKRDLDNKTVGNAATQVDWAASHPAGKATMTSATSPATSTQTSTATNH